VIIASQMFNTHYGGGYGPPLQLPTNVPWQTPPAQPRAEFQYEPIIVTADGVSEIRLLEITPAAQTELFPFPTWQHLAPAAQQPNESAPVTVRVRHARLEHGMPAFTALSYCWGSEDNKPRIACNDGTIEITQNLHAALVALRHRRSANENAVEPNYIWIDGICINQRSKPERKQQVPLMREIYERASGVLVWLGEGKMVSSNSNSQFHNEPADGDLAFAIIPRLAAALPYAGQMSALTMRTQDWARLGFPMTDQQRLLSFRAVYRLLRRPWFRRVWVIQEYAVAKSIRFICGRNEADNQVFLDAYAFLSSMQIDAVLNTRWGAENTMHLLRSVRMEQQAGIKADLLTVLQRFRFFHAGVYRDKVYGLIGLASDSFSGPNCLNVEVDYEIPVERVYSELAVNFLCTHRNLDIVSFAGVHEVIFEPLNTNGQMRPDFNIRKSRLPSWVPDWHIPDGTASIQLVEYKGQHGNQQLGHGIQCLPASAATNVFSVNLSEFRASGNLSYSPGFTEDGMGLKVRAQFLGTISTFGSSNYEQPALPPDWWSDASLDESLNTTFSQMEWFGNWVATVGAESPQPYFTGESMLDVLWQTMLCGHYLRGLGAERDAFMEWYSGTRTARSLCQQLRTRPWLRIAAIQAYQAYKVATGGFGIASSFIARTKTMTANKSIFRTSGGSQPGGYVGLAPRGIRAGDWVVILEGGNVPFVVRQASGDWQIVGACYLHGCMHGQVFDQKNCVDVVFI